jgi:hypothetical protein
MQWDNVILLYANIVVVVANVLAALILPVMSGVDGAVLGQSETMH